MSANPINDHNASPAADDGTGLRGGTQGGRFGALIDPDQMPSEGTAGSPAGSDTPATHTRGDGGTRQRGDDTDSTDAGIQEADHGTRHPSPAEVRTAGRDEAAAGTYSGFNEDDEADKRKDGRSGGNMTDKSQHNPGEPGNAVHTA